MWVKIKVVLLVAFLIHGLCGVALACQVPVFRYALERWVSDVYPVKVLSAGQLSESEAKVVEYLNKAKADPDYLPNFSIDVATDPTAGESTLEIYYPQKNRGTAPKQIWKGPLTAENAKKAVESPARLELIKRILSGDSIVWVFMPSGNAETDQAVRETLDMAIAKAREKLNVPEGVVTDTHAETHGFTGDPEDVVSSGVPLKIAFSALEISRDEPAEEIFTTMFLHLEEDLYDFSEAPLVFPVFGRGRVLEPLIGKGINLDTILEYSSYLCGACSCEVKGQNPGMDLLVAANWDTAIEGSTAFLEKILPPLEGPAALTKTETPFLPVSEVEPIAIRGSSPYRTWIIVTGAVLLMLAIGSQLIKRSSSK